jgi:enamine deaminase RidA (YjgF/YER057c/UK114 family)
MMTGVERDDCRRLREGGSYEDEAGYSRAVRRGRLIAVSGTTCRPDVVDLGTYAQTVDCLEHVVAAVEQLGGSRSGIFRTRLFLAPGADWRAASRAHREILGTVAPANTTLFVHGLIGDGLLVEVEANALADADWPAPAPEPDLNPDT